MYATINASHNQEANMQNEQTNDMQAWVTVKQAAEILGHTEQWTRTLIRRGFIQAQKFGRDWLVLRASIDTYKRERDNPPA